MTKDEIKKAIVACNHSTPDCKKCPYFKKVYFCKTTLTNDALELITEQEKEIKSQFEEIEKHEATIDGLQNLLFEANKFDAENKKLKAENKKLKDEKRNIQVGYTEYALKEDERLEKLRNEIGELKQQNRKLFDDNMANYKKLKKEERKAVKQGKIDVLTALKEKAISLSAIETYHICNLVDEMIEELKK